MGHRATFMVSSLALGIAWIYQGLIPKLLFTDTGEIEILKQSGLFAGNEVQVITFIGWAEIIFGLVIIFVHRRSVHYLNILLLVLLSIAALFSDPAIFTFPFNPFSLNLSMIALSVIAILNLEGLPRASRGKTRQGS